MFRRLFFLILAAIAAYVWVRRWWVRNTAQARPAPGPRAGATAAGEKDMVRDRVCNTFLPRSRALSLTVDGQEHFFCSEPCRSKFLAAQPAGPASPAGADLPDPSH